MVLSKHINKMSNILEEGESIEVNLDAAAVGLMSSPPVEKEPKPTTGTGRRFLPFSFRRPSAVTEDTSTPPAAIAVPSPSSSCHDDEEYDELEMDEEPVMQVNKSKMADRTRSYIYEEEPELLQTSTKYDDQSLAQAETLENLLGSAMRLAEEGTGENFLSLSRVPRDDAIELGRRVSTFSDIRAKVAPTSPPLLQDDEGSVHTANTHATETSFIKVPHMDPASIPQDFWTSIMRMMSLDNDERDGTATDTPKPAEEGPTQTSSTRPQSDDSKKQTLEQTAPSPPRSRKWDKLRNTFVAQENGLSVGHEAQADSQLSKPKPSPPRRPILGKGLSKSVANTKERSIIAKSKSTDQEDFCMALGPVPEPPPPSDASLQMEERVFDVNIRVEDLSKEHEDQYSDNSFDSSADSQSDDDESDESDESDQKAPVEASFDHEEAESMEVVYLIPDDSREKGDVLPPFPSKIFGVPTQS